MLLIRLPINTGRIVFGGTTELTVNTLADTDTLHHITCPVMVKAFSL